MSSSVHWARLEIKQCVGCDLVLGFKLKEGVNMEERTNLDEQDLIILAQFPSSEKN
jgi:hypothetical protein